MRQTDINRINRAAEHLHATQVLLSNIKDKDMEADDRDRRRIFMGRISSRYEGGSYYQFLARIGYAKEKEYINKVRRCACFLY